MINEVTESVEAFLAAMRPTFPPPLANADIRFDRPTDPYDLEQPTVNLYLFEVREDLDLRSNEPVVRRVNGQPVVEPPPYRLMCTYLVTAWPIGADLPKQGHKLLGQLLQLFAGTPTIPPQFLTPALQNQEPPLPMVLLQPDGIRNPAEFWAAIGNRLRPSLLLSVTVSVPVFPSVKYPNVITSEMRLEKIPGGAPLDAPFFRIAGTVTNAAHAPVANAGVRLVEAARSTLTDGQGRFTLSAIRAGALTLRVTAGAVTQDKAVDVPTHAGNDYDVQLT